MMLWDMVVEFGLLDLMMWVSLLKLKVCNVCEGVILILE